MIYYLSEVVHELKENFRITANLEEFNEEIMRFAKRGSNQLLDILLHKENAIVQLLSELWTNNDKGEYFDPSVELEDLDKLLSLVKLVAAFIPPSKRHILHQYIFLLQEQCFPLNINHICTEEFWWMEGSKLFYELRRFIYKKWKWYVSVHLLENCTISSEGELINTSILSDYFEDFSLNDFYYKFCLYIKKNDIENSKKFTKKAKEVLGMNPFPNRIFDHDLEDFVYLFHAFYMNVIALPMPCPLDEIDQTQDLMEKPDLDVYDKEMSRSFFIGNETSVITYNDLIQFEKVNDMDIVLKVLYEHIQIFSLCSLTWTGRPAFYDNNLWKKRHCFQSLKPIIMLVKSYQSDEKVLHLLLTDSDSYVKNLNDGDRLDFLKQLPVKKKFVLNEISKLTTKLVTDIIDHVITTNDDSRLTADVLSDFFTTCLELSPERLVNFSTLTNLVTYLVEFRPEALEDLLFLRIAKKLNEFFMARKQFMLSFDAVLLNLLYVWWPICPTAHELLAIHLIEHGGRVPDLPDGVVTFEVTQLTCGISPQLFSFVNHVFTLRESRSQQFTLSDSIAIILLESYIQYYRFNLSVTDLLELYKEVESRIQLFFDERQIIPLFFFNIFLELNHVLSLGRRFYTSDNSDSILQTVNTNANSAAVMYFHLINIMLVEQAYELNQFSHELRDELVQYYTNGVYGFYDMISSDSRTHIVAICLFLHVLLYVDELHESQIPTADIQSIERAAVARGILFKNDSIIKLFLEPTLNQLLSMAIIYPQYALIDLISTLPEGEDDNFVGIVHDTTFLLRKEYEKTGDKNIAKELIILSPATSFELAKEICTYDELVELVDIVHSVNFSIEWANLLMGRRKYNNGDIEGAKVLFEALLDSQDKNVLHEATFLLASLEFSTDRIKRPLELLKTLPSGYMALQTTVLMSQIHLHNETPYLAVKQLFDYALGVVSEDATNEEIIEVLFKEPLHRIFLYALSDSVTAAVTQGNHSLVFLDGPDGSPSFLFCLITLIESLTGVKHFNELILERISSVLGCFNTIIKSNCSFDYKLDLLRLIEGNYVVDTLDLVVDEEIDVNYVLVERFDHIIKRFEKEFSQHVDIYMTIIENYCEVSLSIVRLYTFFMDAVVTKQISVIPLKLIEPNLSLHRVNELFDLCRSYLSRLMKLEPHNPMAWSLSAETCVDPKYEQMCIVQAVNLSAGEERACYLIQLAHYHLRKGYLVEAYKTLQVAETFSQKDFALHEAFSVLYVLILSVNEGFTSADREIVFGKLESSMRFAKTLGSSYVLQVLDIVSSLWYSEHDRNAKKTEFSMDHNVAHKLDNISSTTSDSSVSYLQALYSLLIGDYLKASSQALVLYEMLNGIVDRTPAQHYLLSRVLLVFLISSAVLDPEHFEFNREVIEEESDYDDQLLVDQKWSIIYDPDSGPLTILESTELMVNVPQLHNILPFIRSWLKYCEFIDRGDLTILDEVHHPMLTDLLRIIKNDDDFAWKTAFQTINEVRSLRMISLISDEVTAAMLDNTIEHFLSRFIKQSVYATRIGVTPAQQVLAHCFYSLALINMPFEHDKAEAKPEQELNIDDMYRMLLETGTSEELEAAQIQHDPLSFAPEFQKIECVDYIRKALCRLQSTLLLEPTSPVINVLCAYYSLVVFMISGNKEDLSNTQQLVERALFFTESKQSIYHPSEALDRRVFKTNVLFRPNKLRIGPIDALSTAVFGVWRTIALLCQLTVQKHITNPMKPKKRAKLFKKIKKTMAKIQPLPELHEQLSHWLSLIE
ncbi:hypothetical protein PCE1_002623 [Barthelona sp. PCE]